MAASTDSETIKVDILLAWILFDGLFNDGVLTGYGIKRRETGWLCIMN
jgi:hypothetical protein